MMNVERSIIFSVGLFSLTVHASLVAAPGGIANAADGATGFGSVGYDYWISDYEVSAAEYTVFLNAVASSDPLGFYSTQMPNTGNAECDIIRSGASGSYSYVVSAASANRPVNFVTFNDAARYANWLTTGDINTGVYTFTEGGSGVDVLSTMDHVAAGRLYYAAYSLPTEDEWYKAAYFDPGTSSFYLYPTSNNTQPSNYPLGTSTNEATIYYGQDPFYTIGPPLYRTEVGAHVNTTSPYGVFDMGGNVWEWTEGIMYNTNRVIRGGSYDEIDDASANMRSTTRNGNNPPTAENAVIGFRLILTVPEPGACCLLSLGGVVGSLIRRRRSA